MPRAAGLLLLAGALSCASQVRIASAPPPPRPRMAPLRVAGTRFTVPMRGAVICCREAKRNGWPLVRPDALREMAEAGVNWTHIRLGPFSAAGEGAAYVAYRPDGSWNDSFWRRVRETLSAALALGIYVEVDVIDAWVLKHGLSPWGEDCAVLRHVPAAHHLSWIEKVVEETGGFPNVTYLVGNEGFACDTTATWELGVRDALRAALGGRRRLVATNSHDPTLERQFDYITRHAKVAQTATDRPIIVNETGALSPEQFRDQLLAAHRNGTYFVLWRGRMGASAWRRALGYLRQHGPRAG